MSAPGRSQALMPEPFKGEGAPVIAPGRSQALMPEPFKGEGTPASISWVGVDWGTTHRRAWWFADGRLQARHADDLGLLRAAPDFAGALQALLQALGAPPHSRVVMAGMVGSASGWQEVPYLSAGRPLADWAQALQPVQGTPGCSIVPGCIWHGEQGDVDVMRGEETQLLGAWALDGRDGWAVLPGTHSKWVQVQDGAVRRLHTHLSGELHALLSAQGTLAPLLAPLPGDGAQSADPLQHAGAFAQGVAAAGRAALGRALFGLRARVVSGALPRQQAAAYLSGVLLGAEWREARELGLAASADAAPVRLIGSPALTRLHAAVADLHGIAVQVMDIEAVQCAAWQALGATGDMA